MQKKTYSLYRTLERNLRADISSGIYKPGSRLPSEQELVEEYNVSRITVRNAMDILVNDGYVVRIRGKGSFVSDSLPSPDAPPSVISAEKTLFGIIVPHMVDIHITKIIQAIVDQLNSKGYSAIIKVSHHKQELEKEAIKSLLALGVKGLIIYPVQNEVYNEEIMQLVLNKYPFVLLDRELTGLNASSVVTDNRTAAMQAVEYLLSLGHRRIGIATQPLSAAVTLQERHGGYLQAHTEAKIKLDGRLQYIEDKSYQIDLSIDSDIMSIKRKLLKKFIESHDKMTALICFDPVLGALAFDIYNELGYKVPDDVSLIQFDEIMTSEYDYVTPTHIKQDSILMGKIAARYIMEMISNPETFTTPKKKRIPTELIKRHSTGVLKTSQ